MNDNVVFKCNFFMFGPVFFWTSAELLWRGWKEEGFWLWQRVDPSTGGALKISCLADARAVFQMLHIILRLSVRSQSSALDPPLLTFFLLLIFCRQLLVLDALLRSSVGDFSLSILCCWPFG